MMRVLIAAASPVVRAGLEAMVAGHVGLEVVGQASGVLTLLAQMDERHPDLVLIDLGRSDDPSLPPILSELLSVPHVCPVVVLTDDHPPLWAREALRAGVRGMLPRETSADEVVAAIGAAAAGLVTVHPAFVSVLAPAPAARPPSPPASHDATLTPREVEVLHMLAEGLGNKAIADRLGISEHTVKFHIGSIFGKLRVSSRTEAVTLGIRQGIIML